MTLYPEALEGVAGEPGASGATRFTFDRRKFLVSLPLLAAALNRARAAAPAGTNIRWAVSSGLWRHYPGTTFSDILAVMKDTGFAGVRMVDFPQCLTEYNLTEKAMARELSKWDRHLATISWHGRLQDPAARADDLASARRALTFLSHFGATHLVVFPPARDAPGAGAPAAFATLCRRCMELGELAGNMGFTIGLHNHLGTMVQNQDEVDRFMAAMDPKVFGLSPDTAHLDLAGCDVVGTLERYKRHVRFLDYKDARWTTSHADWVNADGTVYKGDSESARFMWSIHDLGDGEVNFPGCHRVLKSAGFRGWICVDLDAALHGPRVSFARSRAYIERVLEPIYA